MSYDLGVMSVYEVYIYMSPEQMLSNKFEREFRASGGCAAFSLGTTVSSMPNYRSPPSF